jgi:hypothetical protein
LRIALGPGRFSVRGEAVPASFQVEKWSGEELFDLVAIVLVQNDQ